MLWNYKIERMEILGYIRKGSFAPGFSFDKSFLEESIFPSEWLKFWPHWCDIFPFPSFL